MTKFGEWKIWNGGSHHGIYVQPQFRSQTRYEAERNQVIRAWIWGHSGGDSDIIAYREVIEPKRQTVTLWASDDFINSSGIWVSKPRQPGEDICITYDLVDGVFDETTLKAERVDDR